MNHNTSNFFITTEPEQIDIDFVHNYLSNESYWARGRSRDTVERSVNNSLCFGVFRKTEAQPENTQIGFARVVTDYATFGWICDVFIDSKYRGQSLGVETICSHSTVLDLNLMLLATSDAHELYKNSGGFVPLDEVEKWMRNSITPPPGNKMKTNTSGRRG